MAPTILKEDFLITEPFKIYFRGPFFRDPFFKSSWAIIDQHKTEYEIKNKLEHGKYSLEKDLPFRSAIIQTPHIVNSTQKFSRIAVEEIDGGKDGQVDSLPESDGNENLKPQYQVILDTQHFRPDEISVTGRFSLKDDPEPCTITIEGRHEEKADLNHHGIVSRHFTRKYNVPANVQLDQIQCNMSSDGILQIVLPKIPETQAAAPEMPEKGESLATKMKHSLVDPILHILPDFHLVPFWHRFTTKKPPMGIQLDCKDKFIILVDVKEFTPEELSIESSEYVVRVEGKHADKRDDHGLISRTFSRVYDLPKSVQAQDISCVLLPGGVLEIAAPKAKGFSEAPMLTVPLTISDEAEQEIVEEEKRRDGMDNSLELWLMSQI
jgi:HSP20 family molecular chaperone IbpA